MSKLIGLAFTSPGIAFLAVDREKYRVYYHDQATLTDFRLFLEAKDAKNRLPVVFSNNIRDLAELKPIGGETVACYVLFEDPKVLSNIEGAELPDCKEDQVTEWKKLTVTPEIFNHLLGSGGSSFEITEKALRASSLMPTAITFIELLKIVEDSFKELEKDYEEFVVTACKYVTKLINKKTWVASARKPALAVGVPIKTLAELEKCIETSKTSDELWRAFYDFTNNGVGKEEVLSKYSIAREDLELVISKIGAESGVALEFLAAPGVSKRKKAKAS